MTAVAITLRITGRILKIELTDQMLETLKRYFYAIRLPQWFDRLLLIASTALTLYAPCSIRSMFKCTG